MRFKYNAGVKPMAPAAQAALDHVLEKCDITGALVTSTVRTPDDQARIMYENFESWHALPNGPDKDAKNPRKLYKPAFGGLIIDVYESQKAMGATAEAVKHAMVQKIIEVGPEKISAHCTADPKKSVFDVAPSSIPDDRMKMFVNQVAVMPRLIKFLRPPADPAFHIELKVA
jgi:hypothetical protein